MSIEVCEWKALPKNMNNPLHTMCSYMAMFPPCVPHYFIEKYSNEGDVVLDPFSGRGTTILEACLMKRKAIGNDRNPLAFLLTKAKAHIPPKGRVLSRINRLEHKFDGDIGELKRKHIIVTRIIRIGKEGKNIETTGKFQKPHYTEYQTQEEVYKRVLEMNYTDSPLSKATLSDLKRKIRYGKQFRIDKKTLKKIFSYENLSTAKPTSPSE